MSSSINTALAGTISCAFLIGCYLCAPSTPAIGPIRPLKSSTPTIAQAASALGTIAFASDRDGNFEIYLMQSDGGGQTRLTENPGEDHSPAWSPDGARLAFVSTRDGNSEIYVMNSDGTGQTRLSNHTAGDLAPAWTRDGSRIAFVTNRDGNDEIYLMNADGSNQTNLTNNPADDDSFSFSPDGLRIAFSSTREDSQHEVYTMNLDGGGINRLTNSEGDDIYPSFSSQRIVFQSNRDENDELYSISFDGQNQTRLTNSVDFDIDPSQSDDGSRILFSTSRDGNLEIYLMNANGSGLIRLTNNNAADVQPALQPKGLIPQPPPAGAATVQFSAADFSVGEDQPSGILTVVRGGDSNVVSSVDFFTVNGSATNRADYTFRSGTLQFNPGETSKTITVLITDDEHVEDNEKLTVTLSKPMGAALGGFNTATLTIVDNDSSRLNSNPSDRAQFFVNQHYLDFLNRAPDQAGLNFWINEIVSCGNNFSCLELKRINVSAAFFLSIEFQQTGYLVYRIHKAAYGDLPGAPVPIRLNDFLPDTQKISSGVIVGQVAWEQVLENNKRAFAEEFVLRPRFTTEFPTTLTPSQFVDALYNNAGIVPSAVERASVIGEFGAATTTGDTSARARALRRVAENASLVQQEFNRAFVLMQYFGYLRRNPNDSPDINFDGFNFWLNKLNQFNGNFIQAEMVKAFILSIEYRERFGPPG